MSNKETFNIEDAGFNVGVNVHIVQRNKETGRVITERNVHNRCLKTELLAIVKFLDGQFNTTIPYNLSRNYIPNYLGVGTNMATYDSSGSVTSVVDVNDSRLLHEIGPRMALPQKNTIINKQTQDYIQLVIVAYLPSEYYNGYTLREAGLFSKATGNNCLFRVVFDGIEKTEDSVIEVNWTITVISVESQHEAYESVDKADLKAAMDRLLDTIASKFPDVKRATDDLKDPAITDYKNMSVSQNKVDEDTSLLNYDYLAIKDLDPQGGTIPPGYMDTREGDVEPSDIVEGEIAFSNEQRLVGTMQKLQHTDITKTTSTDFAEIIQSGRKYLKVESTPNIGEIGTKKYAVAGEYGESLLIPYDVLAAYFNVRPEIIKKDEVILGVVGTYEGEE